MALGSRSSVAHGRRETFYPGKTPPSIVSGYNLPAADYVRST